MPDDVHDLLTSLAGRGAHRIPAGQSPIDETELPEGAPAMPVEELNALFDVEIEEMESGSIAADDEALPTLVTCRANC
ncbi:hypothetical protein [Streptomyces sp. NPDC047061]|uniref:hypothetical protein n=1 Tax=Streptomyces sp. NPDC047061 TaxID=3154605 RepID=UPI0034011B3F